MSNYKSKLYSCSKIGLNDVGFSDLTNLMFFKYNNNICYSCPVVVFVAMTDAITLCNGDTAPQMSFVELK